MNSRETGEIIKKIPCTPEVLSNSEKEERIKELEHLISIENSNKSKNHHHYIGREDERDLINLPSDTAIMALKCGVVVGVCSEYEDYHGTYKGMYAYNEIDLERALKSNENSFRKNYSISPFYVDPKLVLRYLNELIDLIS